MSSQLKHIGPKGSGYFCDVIQYRNEETNTDYALKILKKKHYSNDGYRYRLIREIKLLKELDECEYIIDLIRSGNDKEKEKIWYLMPFAQNNLYKYIKSNNVKLTITERFLITDQVINAIKFAHSKNILHRDISPNNVLVFEEDGKLKVKVSDFGLGKDEDSLSFYTGSSASGYGQILYVSPEQRVKLKDATEKSDIYSLGKLIYFVFTGKDPDNIKQFELSPLVSKSIEEVPQDRFADIIEFEKKYLALKKLHFDKEIPIELLTLQDLAETDEANDWLHFHQVAVKGNYSDHVYHEYISPAISILNKEDNITAYYKAIGSDFRSFIHTFSKRLDDCVSTVGWPFSETSTFGYFLESVILQVNDAEVRLICFEQLWKLAFESDQWAVQATIKRVFNKTYIANEIQISLADFIQKKAIEVDMSHFSNLDVPKIVKTGIIQSNEAFKNKEAERQKKQHR